MVGFNRRFSQHARAVSEFFSKRQSPLVITYRVNAGRIGKESWVQDMEEGGGRIIGEVCHFVDLCEYLTGSALVGVYAACISAPGERETAEDSVAITLTHADGSVSAIQYIALGPKNVGKERIEVYGEGTTAMVMNFGETKFFGAKEHGVRGRQDKGFEEELKAFMQAVRQGGELPIPFESLVRTTRATFAILESLKTGQPVAI
jgi:polar amino acid transport system substrate-binding protein